MFGGGLIEQTPDATILANAAADAAPKRALGSDERFPTERDETAGCQYATTPNDTTVADGGTGGDATSDIQRFSAVMRVLAPPEPSSSAPRRSGGSAGVCSSCTTAARATCSRPSARTAARATRGLRRRRPRHANFCTRWRYNAEASSGDQLAYDNEAGTKRIIISRSKLLSRFNYDKIPDIIHDKG